MKRSWQWIALVLVLSVNPVFAADIFGSRLEVGDGTWNVTGDSVTAYSWTYGLPGLMIFGSVTDHGYIEATMKNSGYGPLGSQGLVVCTTKQLATDDGYHGSQAFFVRYSLGVIELLDAVPYYLSPAQPRRLASIPAEVAVDAKYTLRIEVDINGRIVVLLNNRKALDYISPYRIVGKLALLASNGSYIFEKVSYSQAGPTDVNNRATRLLALSTRSQSGTGADTLIVGAVVGGTGSKNLIARGVGPNLANYGVSGYLADPQLKLFDGTGALVRSNDDWGGGLELSNAFAAVGLAALPSGSKDAAFLLSSNPGVFTIHLTSSTGTGIGLIELYDYGSDSDISRLSALSVRSQVGSGANVLIVGFVISGTGSKQLIIRGVGPNLSASGVVGYLPDPQLKLFNSSGNQISGNDDWGGGATLANAFGAVGLAALPANSRDAAILVTLATGVYTVQLSGLNDTTGVGLLELYEIP